MRAVTGWLACVLAAVFLCGPLEVARAQECEPGDPQDWMHSPQPKDDRSYASARERFADELEHYRYAEVFRALEQDLRVWMLEHGDDEPHLKLLHMFGVLNGEFSHYEEELARLAGRSDATDRALGKQATNEFLKTYRTGLFQFVEAYPRCGWFSAGYTVSCDELDAVGRSDPCSVEDFLFRATTVDSLLWEFTTRDSALAQTVQGIRLAADRWENFLSGGKTMYPWEAGLNAWWIGGGSPQEPPMHQWILLHPQVCVSVSTRSFGDLTARDAFLVEAFGHLWYSWQDENRPEDSLRWWGLTAVAVFREDVRPGAGIALEYGRTMTLGVTWHDDDEDDDWFDDEPYVVMSVDLLSFVQEKASQYRSLRKQAQDRFDGMVGR